MRQKFVLSGLAAIVAMALACADKAADPLSPSGDTGGTTNAEAATLKVSAPTPISPVNDVQPTVLTLTATPAEGKFVPAGPLQYNFEVYNSANVRVVNDTDNSPSHTVATPLDFGKRYTWRVRATSDGAFGPFSAAASFTAPAGGYMVAGELYDPLVNGRTQGTIHGSVDFLPGVGLRMNGNTSYVDYQLPGTIEEGEISAVVTNLCSCSGQPGIKTRIFSMSAGYDNMTTNARRFTIEKRSGSDKGVVAWRVITSGSQIETEGAERVFVNFNPSSNYLWRATWANTGNFNLTVDEIGGGRVYEFGKHYNGRYNPNPHVVFIGSPDSTSGPESQTVANMIIRQLWVSSRPRVSGITQ
jgi:hypothetical protein